jgi:hypothetical protein
LYKISQQGEGLIVVLASGDGPRAPDPLNQYFHCLDGAESQNMQPPSDGQMIYEYPDEQPFIKAIAEGEVNTVDIGLDLGMPLAAHEPTLKLYVPHSHCRCVPPRLHAFCGDAADA